MNIELEIDLPTNADSKDYQYESPIYCDDDVLYFITDRPNTILHIVDTNVGKEKIQPIISRCSVIPSEYFFEKFRDKLIIYTGELSFYENESIVEFPHVPIDDRINSHLIKDNYFIFADHSNLICFNLDTQNVEWQLGIANTKLYEPGEISLFGDDIACYGNDKLLIVDIFSGTIKDQILIPHINKAFGPIKIDDNTLLIGFTNWLNAGILKYDMNARKVLWKNKRSFEGPLLRCKIYQKDNFAYWVKNDTELICVDINSGDEAYSVKTMPWLYTDLLFEHQNLFYGTAGRDGYFVNLDPETGCEKWSFFLKNGCAYFDFYDKSVVLGDFEKTIYRIDATNGEILSRIFVDGEVVGRIKTHRNNVYTVIWGSERAPIRLIKIKI